MKGWLGCSQTPAEATPSLLHTPHPPARLPSLAPETHTNLLLGSVSRESHPKRGGRQQAAVPTAAPMECPALWDVQCVGATVWGVEEAAGRGQCPC